MSRKVYVTSDMGKDDALLAVYDECPQAALLWPWFITAFDDWGRCHANARILRREVFPLFDHITAEDVEATLTLYARHGLVTLYRVGSKPYVCIRPEKWWRYQTHIHEEKRKLADDPIKGSHCPAPPAGVAVESARESAYIKEASAEVRGDARTSAERSASFPPSPPPSFPPSHLSSSPSHPPGVAPDADAPDAPQSEILEPVPIKGAALVPVPKPTPEHPFRDLWEAFDAVFGEARSRTEKSRRAAACKDAKEGGASGEEIQAAAAHWPNVMGDATMTEHGIVANLGKLLTGPQLNGRSAGTTRQHRQSVTEYANVNRGPKRGVEAIDHDFSLSAFTAAEKAKRNARQ